MTDTTREEWLNRAAARLNEKIAEATDLKPAKKFLVSCGWPRRERGGLVLGTCTPTTAGGGVPHIFVTPRLSKATEVLPVLLHELIHAADDCEHQHSGAFRKAHKAVGFIDKPTTSVPGKELKRELAALAKELGAYPHRALNPVDGEKKQSTRMLKIECERCGCIVRMTRKWLDETGVPTCGCGGVMEEAA